MSDEILMQIARDVGEIKGTLASHVKTFEAHCVADAELAQTVKTLELTAARQKGSIRTLTTIGTALGASLGYLLEKLTFGHH